MLKKLSSFANTYGGYVVIGAENGGGKPEMVVLIASYLLDHRTHLGDLWDRYADSTHHHWTQDSVAERRFGSAKPVYVLTSAHTFSADEEFAYDLQALKRVTIVGETTGAARIRRQRDVWGTTSRSMLRGGIRSIRLRGRTGRASESCRTSTCPRVMHWMPR